MVDGDVLATETSPAPSPILDRVLTALDVVRDPELDESITALGFVASCRVSCDGVAQIHLRLPTYFCAPNFAFLMVADAYDAVSAVPGIAQAVVVLDDHFASDTINAGVAARAGFVGSFGDEAADELDALRTDFIRKAVLAGTDRVYRPLLAAGTTPVELAGLRLGQLPDSPELARLRERRRDIGLPADDDSFLLIDAITGEPVGSDDLRLHLGKARLTRVNIEANGSICRGMLANRYSGRGLGQDDDHVSAGPDGPGSGPERIEEDQ